MQINRLKKEIKEMDAESERLKEKLPEAEDEKRNGIKKRIAEISAAVSEKQRFLDEKIADIAEVEEILTRG